MIVVVGITVAAGNWQGRRAAQKEMLAADYAAAAAQPPVELEPADADATRLRYRMVRATGEFDAARQLFIDNRVHAGRAGFEVVAPLKLRRGNRYVLVDRGWVAQGAQRSQLPDVPPPAGAVTVVGRVNLPPQHYLELGSERGSGPIWQNLDLERIAAATGLELLPIVVEQSDAGAPADGLIRERPPPDLGSERNRSYMLQWYSFAALAVVLWLALNWRPSEDARG
jgi:surfeit locus 1 family protein